MARKIRVLIAKPGLDGHEAGAKFIARGLSDAGIEVIYTGMRQTPEMIAKAALEEDVDVVGLSILSGAHLGLTAKVIRQLRKKGAGKMLVLVGGIIPHEDISVLKEIGVSAVFGPGTDIRDVVSFIKHMCPDDGN
ncbi:cobalamin B12-binding domain-containing protein [Chloroflexota bacterium]